MITVTEDAANELKTILDKEGRPEAGLRVFVSPGGCSGLSYGMTLEDAADECDHVIEQLGIKLYVDEFSANYLQGSEIDWSDSLMGGGFTVRNPNAKTTCGCGQSFDTGSSASTARSCH